MKRVIRDLTSSKASRGARLAIGAAALAALLSAACESRHAAPPPPSTDPRAARDAALAHLQASGPAGAAAHDAERAIEQAVARLPSGLTLAAKGAATDAGAACWAGGCAVETRIARGEDVRARQTDLLRALKETWSGPVFISGPLPTPEGDTSCTAFVQVQPSATVTLASEKRP